MRIHRYAATLELLLQVGPRRRMPVRIHAMPDASEVAAAVRPIRAAQYVRMSTEHQQYSIENQLDAIGRYAKEHGMDTVRTYVDDGKSGLNIAGRRGLRELIADVERGTADFEVILVYDVSRWGRFQDVDESAYYEFLVRQANIVIHYCAEPFVNDGSLPSSVLKTIKRTMAGEYSRELSVKVFAGQCRLIELGFRQGGPPGYGLRRLLIDQHRNPKTTLNRGEQKSIQTDRVILIPGPAEEVAVVKEIYRRFTEDRQSESEIAYTLNTRGILTDFGRPWTRATVHQILTNAKYIGANVYNRRSFKLKKRRVVNPPDMWICRDQAFEGLITPDVFRAAQEIIAARHKTYSDEQMLQLLRKLLEQKGFLSGILIDETDGMPSSSAYSSRFKGLLRAYHLVGYTPQRDHSYLEINRQLREYHRTHVQGIVAELKACGATVTTNPETDVLTINEEFTAALILARCREVRSGIFRWFLRLDTSLSPDITIAARLQPGNQEVLDYYLLPSMDKLAERLRLAPDNGFLLDVYRFKDLSILFTLSQRLEIEEAA